MSMFKKKEAVAQGAEEKPVAAASAVDEPAGGAPVEGGAWRVEEIEAKGRDIVVAMRQIRELLEARASALEACRDALGEHYRRLAEEREQLNRGEGELCGQIEHRQVELDEREKSLAQREQQLVTEQEAIKTQLAAFEQDRARLEQSNRALETAQTELKVRSEQLREQQESFADQHVSVSRQVEECRSRAAEQEQLAAALEAKSKELEAQQAQLALTQKEWESRMREVTAARDSLAALQTHLDSELAKATEQKADLLPKYGVLEQGASSGAPADAGLPKVDQEARESMERFMKLCRDAKRRAIGA